MRYFIFGILFLCLNYCAESNASLQTETHTYLYSEHQRHLLEIDRITNEEIKIDIGLGMYQMLINNGYGYIINKQTDSVIIINLNTHEISNRISLDKQPNQMVIHNNHLYIIGSGFYAATLYIINLSSEIITHTLEVGRVPNQFLIHDGIGYVLNTGSNNLMIVDLDKHVVTTTFEICKYPRNFIIHNGIGYCLSSLQNKVYSIDLKTHTISSSLLCGLRPIQMHIHENVGYVVNNDSHDLSIIDLQTQLNTKTISVDKYPVDMKIRNGLGYVFSEHHGTVTVIDLQNHEIITKMPLGRSCRNFLIHKGFGYVMNIDSNDVSIIDLEHNEVVDTFENYERLPIDFSDTHIYIAERIARPLPVHGLELFTKSFNGLDTSDLHTGEDDNTAFKEFEEAAQRNDYAAARASYAIALSLGHSKAYAVAFLAFCRGIWGAPQSDAWAAEFYECMDKTYLTQLIPNRQYPHDFVLRN